MKKMVFLYPKFLTLIILSLITVSCKKVSDSHPLSLQTNYMVGIQEGSKTNQEYVMVIEVGHNGANCNGCVLIDRQWIHIDCQGQGNACRLSANVTLYNNGATSYAVTTDTFGLTDQNYFNMPARSLSAEDEKGQPVFLNIPAQLVYRDSSTLQFTFNGLFYSSSAVYSND